MMESSSSLNKLKSASKFADVLILPNYDAHPLIKRLLSRIAPVFRAIPALQAQ
jgi:hypothetical protein